jgi:hypothetical protein
LPLQAAPFAQSCWFPSEVSAGQDRRRVLELEWGEARDISEVNIRFKGRHTNTCS